MAEVELDYYPFPAIIASPTLCVCCFRLSTYFNYIILAAVKVNPKRMTFEFLIGSPTLTSFEMMPVMMMLKLRLIQQRGST